MSMQILNYADVPGNPSIVGTFDLYFAGWEMTWVELKLIRTKKGGYFVGLPTKSKKKDDGGFDYVALIKFSDKKSKDFQKGVVELLKPFARI